MAIKKKIKTITKELCPPIIWKSLSSWRKRQLIQTLISASDQQDLEVYWDEQMAEILETWGEGNAWNEIQLLVFNCQGRVLDIACGTGKVMHLLNKIETLEIHGCDISDMLINKAIDRGLERDHLRICDATSLPYRNNEFDYSYSIGSLEHFTEEGIEKVISEAARVTNKASFHMMPTSKSGQNEGWLKTYQSFYNCRDDWWTSKFQNHFRKVLVLDSRWEDEISIGKWFLCQH